MSCVVCKKLWVPGCARSFHRFPKDKDKRSKWLRAINRNDVARYAQLCSDHFEPSDFQETVYGLRSSLKKTAIPRIILQETNYDANNKASNTEEFDTLIQQNTSEEQSDKTEIEECSTECNDPAKDCCTHFQNTSEEQFDKTEIEECNTESNDPAKDCCTHFQNTSKEQSDKTEIEECSTECNDSAKDNRYSLKRKSMEDEIDVPLKHIKYMKDINLYEVSKNEDEAEMVLELAIETIIEQKKKIRRWQKYAYKLKKRVQSLTELTKHLLDNNSISNKV